jgi:phospholipase D-like protein
VAKQPWQEAKNQLSELPRWQRIGTLVVAPLEIILTVTAAVDLARRPSSRIRGPKALWWLSIFIQPVGPIAYLKWGRRR